MTEPDPKQLAGRCDRRSQLYRDRAGGGGWGAFAAAEYRDVCDWIFGGMGSNVPGEKWFVHDKVAVEIAGRLWTQLACVGMKSPADV